MPESSFVRVGQYKSPLRVLAGIFLRSRDAQAERARQKQKLVDEFKRRDQQQRQVIARANERIAELQLELAKRRIANQRLQQQAPVLPDDRPLPHHEFGPKMISVCVNLAMKVGLRASITCMKIVFEWLGVESRLPHWTTVRRWLMRLGVAELEAPIERADDWIWMADHSNQIGQEKALAIIGLRASHMPRPGTAISHPDVRLLMLEPGTSWKTEDMSAAYDRLAKKVGQPLAVLTDGACELRDGAEVLLNSGEDTVLLRDFKHHAANVLKKVVGGDERFTEFTSQTGRTRSSIQQTELAHFVPVSIRPKARFMNLSATLKWANMVLWHLSHAHSEARREITAERMNDKLGWLRNFRDDIRRWTRCQDVVSKCVTFVNEQGLFRGASDQLQQRLTSLPMCETSQTVADRLVEFVRDHERKLPDSATRLPLSTEILESCFGLFKQLERQHSKGGFTSLLASFGALLQPATPGRIREAFARVSVKDVNTWVSENLGKTVASKRQSAFAEFKATA